jgi:hypothetical protein
VEALHLPYITHQTLTLIITSQTQGVHVGGVTRQITDEDESQKKEMERG